MKKQRKILGDGEKIKILKKHLLENVPISEICDEHRVAPSAFYRWQNQLFERGMEGLSKKGKSTKTADRRTDEFRQLQERLRQREEALAELMTEYVALKKSITGQV